MARSGYTLPVFACAGAIAALRLLRSHAAPGRSPMVQKASTLPTASVTLNLLTPDQIVTIPVEQLAPLSATTALAMTRSDPGDNLDLTRDTPIWSQVEIDPAGQGETIVIAGGEGIGIQANGTGSAAIYRYARQLLNHHLEAERGNHKVRVTVILPEGRALAERTSNAAFGVVDGLSLLGTGGIAQPLSAPDQLEDFREQLRAKAARFQHLIFCIGENGLALAPSLGFPPERLVKTANWLGPLLVEAGFLGVERITLLGYHGKLIKLAGGIFHTHHHVADGRQEILTAIAAQQDLPSDILKQLYASATVEAGLEVLRALDDDSCGSEPPLLRPPLSSSPLNSSPLNSSPLNSSPLNSSPLNSSPLNSSPLNSSPLNSSPLNSSPLNSSPLNSSPLNSSPLNPPPCESSVQRVYGAIAQRIDERATDYIRKHCGAEAVTQVECILFDRQRRVIYCKPAISAR